MTFEEKLAMYRQSYGLERQGAETTAPRQMPDEMGGPNWGANTDLEEGAVGPNWGNDGNEPYVMKMQDDRIFGDEEVDKKNYAELLQTDPTVQSFAPQMEEMLKELETQMLDPNNPMTQAQAEKTFVEMMEENFGAKFKGY